MIAVCSRESRVSVKQVGTDMHPSAWRQKHVNSYKSRLCKGLYENAQLSPPAYIARIIDLAFCCPVEVE